MTPYRSRTAAFALSALAAAVAGCSSDDDSSTTDTTDAPTAAPDPGPRPAIPDVDAALMDFPDALLPRFALASDGEAAAAEVYRRVDYVGGVAGDGSWGVEGASMDESVELESRYADDGTLVEATREEVLDEVPEAAAATIASLYPDAEVEEIVRSETDGVGTVSVLLDADGAEVEVNVDDAGTVVSVEEIIERDALPPEVAAVVDAEAGASAAALPDFELERETLAGGEVRYAVEFESDAGQSLTITMDPAGTVLSTEHEDALANLSDSATVDEALEGFPAGIEADFAASFPEVVAAEVFRNLDLSASPDGEIAWGIEGVSADGTLEIEALYAADGTLLSQERGALLESAPPAIQAAFDARYPDAEIEEIVEVGAGDGVRYEIAFAEGDEDELEANFDAAGGFLSLERLLDADATPEAVLEAIGAERVSLPVLEIEEVASADGSLAYEAEYENAPEEDGDETEDTDDGEQGDDGDDADAERAQSISYQIAPDGTLLAIEHEAELPL